MKKKIAVVVLLAACFLSVLPVYAGWPIKDGYDWNRASNKEKAAITNLVVRAVLKRNDLGATIKLLSGLDAFYNTDNPEILFRPFSETAASLLVILGY